MMSTILTLIVLGMVFQGVLAVLDSILDAVSVNSMLKGLPIIGSNLNLIWAYLFVAVTDLGGSDAFALTEWVMEHGTVVGYPNAEPVEPEDFWAVDSDVVVPAALENQVTAEVAAQLTGRVVVEAANGPTTLEAEEVLTARGIDVLPDILVNAGGVVVSYFEWVQNRSAQRWNLDEVDVELRDVMVRACDAVVSMREELAITSRRDAAYALALRRLETVYQQRGIFP